MTSNDGWLEIKDRKSDRLIYVNTKTGKCQYKQPEIFDKLQDDHCWELYDFKSGHYYYHIVSSGKTTWSRPDNIPVIPMVKYQIQKNKKKKTYNDKIIQFDSDNDAQWSLTTPRKSLEPSSLSSAYSYDNENQDNKNTSTSFIDKDGALSTATSIDNLETSGYYSSTTTQQYTQLSGTLPIQKSSHIGGLHIKNNTLQSPINKHNNTNTNIDDNNNNNDSDIIKRLSSTLPAILPSGSPPKRVLPRTNPNYARHDVTMRISQPIMESQQNNDSHVIDVIYKTNSYHQDIENKPDFLINKIDLISPDESSNLGTFERQNTINSSIDEAASNDPSSPIDTIRSTDEVGSPEQNGSLGCTQSTGSLGSIEFASVSNLPINKEPVNTFPDARLPRKSIINSFNRVDDNPFAMEIWSRELFKKSDRQLAGVMSWSSKSLADSILSSTPKAYKKKACENFKQIQMYMNDRSSKVSKDKLAFTICSRGVSSAAWANEILIQICKQVSHNPKLENTFYGWDLMCICLKFFQPEGVQMTKSFVNFVNQYANLDYEANDGSVDREKFVNRQDYNTRIIMCAEVALRLYDRSSKMILKTKDDVIKAKKTYNDPTVFHSSLEDVMNTQKHLFPNRRLPWIIVTMTDEILKHNGNKTQGIFRVPSEKSKIDDLIRGIENAFVITSSDNYKDLPPKSDGCDPLLHKILEENNLEPDPLLFASVLKYWLRYMTHSLIPLEELGEPFTNYVKDFNKLRNTLELIPQIDRNVLKRLIRFLQILSKEEYVQYTNMPVDNLATLMAPTMFKMEFSSLQAAMHILQSLVVNWNTDGIEQLI